MALTADRPTHERVPDEFELGVATLQKFYAGALAARNASGYATPGAWVAGLLGIGRAEEQVDNSAGLDGALTVKIRKGIFRFLNRGNIVQVVTLTGAPEGGTFTLSYGAQTTGTIAYNASSATVLAALEALSNIAPADVAVAGDAGGPWTITFQGSLSGLEIALLTGDGALLTGGTDPDVSIAFGAATGKITGADIGANCYIVEDEAVGRLIASRNEAQVVTLTGVPEGGTFTLTFDDVESGNIAYNAAAATVKTALEALSNIAVDDITVTGNAGGPWTVTFVQVYAATDVPEMVADGANLTGGTNPDATVATTINGVAARSVAGKIVDVDALGAWVEFR